jgi:hypothetical protein
LSNDIVSLTIIRELPKVLPDIFNRTVELIAKNGVKAGLLSSKINPGAHQGLTNNAIRTNLKNYYLTRPFNYPSLAVIAYSLIGIVSFFIIYSLLKNMILLGESYLTLSLISFGGLSPCPCGGTHMNCTAEFESIIISKIKFKKGVAKVSYCLKD